MTGFLFSHFKGDFEYPTTNKAGNRITWRDLCSQTGQISGNDRCQTWDSEREKAGKDILGSEGGENNRELTFYRQ